MRWLAAALLAAAGSAGAQVPYAETGASYDAPTDRYDHGVLGDAIEYGALIVWHDRFEITYTLPEARVFEDIEPRVADLTGDGVPEVIVVETDAANGAQLSVYGLLFDGRELTGIRKIAATEPIGRRYRWLAPAGIADFNQDGQPDIAYVETPHLGKRLTIVTLRGAELEEIASGSGLTNHRIGDDYISGGVRDCGQGPELVLADGDWTAIVTVRLVDGQLQAKRVGNYIDRKSFDPVLGCRN